jgi:hypothetical protein
MRAQWYEVGLLILFYIIGRVGRLDMERKMRLDLGGWHGGVRRLPAGEKGRRHHSGEAVGIVKMERIH